MDKVECERRTLLPDFICVPAALFSCASFLRVLDDQAAYLRPRTASSMGATHTMTRPTASQAAQNARYVSSNI